ncbi:MAG: D-alanine--D-alanine ligase [Lentisphaerae bacterium]|nr:D-alanine--D-alanine ligase [Lentisphaerota bacterium]
MSLCHLLVISGGRSPEHEVALQSALNVVAAVDRKAFDLAVVGIDKDGAWRQLPSDDFVRHRDDPTRIALAPGGRPVTLCCREGRGWMVPLDGSPAWPVDVAFPVLHGAYGEDGTIQGFLALMGVPCVGCDTASSANSMDKAITKRLLQAAGIPVAPGVVVTRGASWPTAEALGREFGWPLFVKPARLGSSVGVVKVKTPAELAPALTEAFRYDDKVLVEQCLRGREIECAVLGNDAPRASLPGEVVPRHEFYSYAAKYLDDQGAALYAPADLPAETTQRVQAMAVAAFQAMGCSGLARVDFFLMPDGSLAVNELNTIPGFTRISMYPRLWQCSGLTYTELVGELVRLAMESHRQRASLCTSFT